MNTDPSAKIILCFGDSNTWGTVPGSDKRYAAGERWTGVLQKILGDKYSIIEEGLSGRTTIYTHPSEPWKNGKDYLTPCLATHDPTDLLIIMLGTNDVKDVYKVSDETIGRGIEELIKTVQGADLIRQPEILIIAPPLITEKANDDPRMSDSVRLSTLFAPSFIAVVKKSGCYFLDASLSIRSSDVDGYHLDRNSHQVLGQVIAEKVIEIIRLTLSGVSRDL